SNPITSFRRSRPKKQVDEVVDHQITASRLVRKKKATKELVSTSIAATALALFTSTLGRLNWHLNTYAAIISEKYSDVKRLERTPERFNDLTEDAHDLLDGLWYSSAGLSDPFVKTRGAKKPKRIAERHYSKTNAYHSKTNVYRPQLRAELLRTLDRCYQQIQEHPESECLQTATQQMQRHRMPLRLTVLAAEAQPEFWRTARLTDDDASLYNPPVRQLEKHLRKCADPDKVIIDRWQYDIPEEMVAICSLIRLMAQQPEFKGCRRIGENQVLETAFADPVSIINPQRDEADPLSRDVDTVSTAHMHCIQRSRTLLDCRAVFPLLNVALKEQSDMQAIQVYFANGTADYSLAVHKAMQGASRMAAAAYSALQAIFYKSEGHMRMLSQSACVAILDAQRTSQMLAEGHLATALSSRTPTSFVARIVNLGADQSLMERAPTQDCLYALQQEIGVEVAALHTDHGGSDAFPKHPTLTADVAFINLSETVRMLSAKVVDRLFAMMSSLVECSHLNHLLRNLGACEPLSWFVDNFGYFYIPSTVLHRYAAPLAGLPHLLTDGLCTYLFEFIRTSESLRHLAVAGLFPAFGRFIDFVHENFLGRTLDDLSGAVDSRAVDLVERRFVLVSQVCMAMVNDIDYAIVGHDEVLGPLHRFLISCMPLLPQETSVRRAFEAVGHISRRPQNRDAVREDCIRATMAGSDASNHQRTGLHYLLAFISMQPTTCEGKPWSVIVGRHLLQILARNSFSTTEMARCDSTMTSHETLVSLRAVLRQLEYEPCPRPAKNVSTSMGKSSRSDPDCDCPDPQRCRINRCARPLQALYAMQAEDISTFTTTTHRGIGALRAIIEQFFHEAKPHEDVLRIDLLKLLLQIWNLNYSTEVIERRGRIRSKSTPSSDSYFSKGDGKRQKKKNFRRSSSSTSSTSDSNHHNRLVLNSCRSSSSTNSTSDSNHHNRLVLSSRISSSSTSTSDSNHNGRVVLTRKTSSTSANLVVKEKLHSEKIFASSSSSRSVAGLNPSHCETARLFFDSTECVEKILTSSIVAMLSTPENLDLFLLGLEFIGLITSKLLKDFSDSAPFMFTAEGDPLLTSAMMPLLRKYACRGQPTSLIDFMAKEISTFPSDLAFTSTSRIVCNLVRTADISCQRGEHAFASVLMEVDNGIGTLVLKVRKYMKEKGVHTERVRRKAQNYVCPTKQAVEVRFAAISRDLDQAAILWHRLAELQKRKKEHDQARRSSDMSSTSRSMSSSSSYDCIKDLHPRFALTERHQAYTQCHYVFGTQALPKSIRDSLRRGGCLAVTNRPAGTRLYWRASWDLKFFEWKLVKPYIFAKAPRCAASSIRNKSYRQPYRTHLVKKAEERARVLDATALQHQWVWETNPTHFEDEFDISFPQFNPKLEGETLVERETLDGNSDCHKYDQRKVLIYDNRRPITVFGKQILGRTLILSDLEANTVFHLRYKDFCIKELYSLWSAWHRYVACGCR
ncbi:MAG: uncharacterized protein KVP18_003033, partial [Porospora cf. gigantea A]